MPSTTAPGEISKIVSHQLDKDRLMHRYAATAALLALTLCLTACSGNYKFSDDEYRPLGEPQAVKRGN
jgi:hypothetical protein